MRSGPRRTSSRSGKPCIVRLHSIEALQTRFPAQMNWARVTRLVTVAEDISHVLIDNFPAVSARCRSRSFPNGIDMERFRPGTPDRFRVAWVGHLEPKKNPMLMMQIAQRTHPTRSALQLSCCRRLHRFADRAISPARCSPLWDWRGVVWFDGPVADMPDWYADKGVLLSTSMYESFGMNIGEAMAVGAFPVVHGFPGADSLWPRDYLFASVDDAVSLIQSGRPGLYREWVAERYGLDRQVATVLRLLTDVWHGAATR